MVNYEYGKIYKITSESTGLTYYGSTAEYYLSKRLSHHIGQYKRYLNGKSVYVSSFELLKHEDYKMELIKDFPSANKTQLTREEGKYVLENECVNIHIPGRTKKEYSKKYYQDNEEKTKQQQKQYYDQNKEQIKEKNKQYRDQNKEQRKEKNKQYVENNKEHIKEYNKEYYQNNKEHSKENREQNKDKINERSSKPYHCECGVVVRWNVKARHFKTKKHCEYINMHLH